MTDQSYDVEKIWALEQLEFAEKMVNHTYWNASEQGEPVYVKGIIHAIAMVTHLWWYENLMEMNLRAAHPQKIKLINERLEKFGYKFRVLGPVNSSNPNWDHWYAEII